MQANIAITWNDYVDNEQSEQNKVWGEEVESLFIYLSPRTRNLVVLYWPVWKGRLLRGPFFFFFFFSASPSPCLRLYVWMPLRRDVKVCGWERASSGMNGFTFWVVFKVQGCFQQQCVLSSPAGRLEAEQQHCSVAQWIYYRGILLVCLWGIRTETHEELQLYCQVDKWID